MQLLSDPDTSKDIANSLHEYFSNNDTKDVNPSALWNAHKAFNRGLLIKKSAILKEEKEAAHEYHSKRNHQFRTPE